MPEWLTWFLIGAGLVGFEAIVAFTLYAGALSRPGIRAEGGA